MYKFNHIAGDYNTYAEEDAALIYQGTYPVEVWRDGDCIATVDVEIYSDIAFDNFDQSALARLGEFVNQEYTA